MLDRLGPTCDDEFIFLGDYVDRGPDTRDCIEQILQLERDSRVIALRGNHEVMLWAVAVCGADESLWLNNGGHATVTSYGGSITKIPESHIEFFSRLRPHFETDGDIFVHAGYVPTVPIRDVDDSVRYWQHLTDPLPDPHFSGKRVTVGHTPQPGGRVLDVGHLRCVDTCCFGGGYLTALQTDDGRPHQFDIHGHERKTWRTRWRDLRRR